MYRAGIEGIIGLSRVGNRLSVNPCFPADWPGVAVTVRFGQALIRIKVDNPDHVGHGIMMADTDGVAAPHSGGPFGFEMRDGATEVRLVLGRRTG